jgi:hypothetical protein
MTRSDGLSQGRETVSRPMPHRSQPQASVLALWSFAMAPAPRCGITGGGAAIAPPVGRAAATVRRRLREWRYEVARTAGTKRGVTRQALDVTTCFVPLLHWAPAWRSPAASRAARAMDARTLGQRCTVLAIRPIYRGCALPMVWVVLPAPPKGAWRSPGNGGARSSGRERPRDGRSS